ncbi:nucleotide-diphospho-sugar transferase [Cadophora sp. MPI-SDFR-AT-0126]|nr:nucleotide-diphospho-sugar transferase [Leotiomycetes sp. MPI-SDFR-AT-0126]
MLWGPALVRSSRSFLKVGGTLGILATTFTTLQFGQLTLTLDLIVKLLITFAYTHGFARFHSKLRIPIYEHPNNKETAFDDDWEGNKLYAIDETCVVEDAERNQSDSISNHSQKITAAVVGWREDEELYRRCLQGLAADPRCGPVIAGIDGDTAQDEEMVHIFMDTFPGGVVIRLKEQLSKTLDRYMLSANLMDVEIEENNTFIMDHVSSFIRVRLEEAIFPRSIKDIQALCIVQPHQSKKDILFTALSFATIISTESNIPYIFSTDSDSMIVPGTLGKIIESLESDANIGGVSGHLRFSHPQPSYLTRMTASHYWFEQEIPKSQGAIFGATECQPGPCAGFRVPVLQSVLVPWFCQSVFGHRTVVNEDRHLTTRILWAGFTVHYAPGAVVHTDTPNTFHGWVKQQVRWSRGTMIETLWYPWMINQLSPWHIYSILKARTVPLLTFWYITSYALGFGGVTPKLSLVLLIDVFCSTALQVVYLVHVSQDRATPSDVIWLVPSLIWYFLMSPGIVVWSLVTMLDDSWGNVPRAMNLGDRQKSETRNAWIGSRIITRGLNMKHVVFQVLWMAIVLMAIIRASLSTNV